ncbi:MAG TPA: hypothetical protein VI248_24225 [Kineosporiaceae bacterium]
MSAPLADAVRMEAVRLRTVRSTYVLVTLATGLGALVALLLALLLRVGPMSGEDTAVVLTDGGDAAPVSLVGVTVALLGVVTVSHDYRYGLVRAVLLAQPRRVVLVAARLLVLSAVAVGVTTVATLLAAGACLASGHAPTLDGATLRVLLLHAGVVIGWAWLGAGLTWLLRHAAGVVAVLLACPLALEPALLLASRFDQAALLRPVVRWLPFSAARQALAHDLAADGAAVLPSAATFAAFAVAAAGLAVLLVRHRDA